VIDCGPDNDWVTNSFFGYVCVNNGCRSGTDCRWPEVMDGLGLSWACVLDTLTWSNGSTNSCKNDGLDVLSTTDVNSAFLI
jgi:hypothetical protein